MDSILRVQRTGSPSPRQADLWLFYPLKQTGGYTYGAPKRNTSIRPTKPPNVVQLLMAMFKYDLRSSTIPNEYTSRQCS